MLHIIANLHVSSLFFAAVSPTGTNRFYFTNVSPSIQFPVQLACCISRRGLHLLKYGKSISLPPSTQRQINNKSAQNNSSKLYLRASNAYSILAYTCQLWISGCKSVWRLMLDRHLCSSSSSRCMRKALADQVSCLLLARHNQERSKPYETMEGKSANHTKIWNNLRNVWTILQEIG